MSKVIKKVLSVVLSAAILCSFTLSVAALEEGQYDTTTAGSVNVSISNPTLTQSDTEQIAYINVFVDKNVAIGSMSLNYSTTEEELTIGTGTVPEKMASNAACSYAGISFSNATDVFVENNTEVGGYVVATIPVTVAANAVGVFTVSFTKVKMGDAENGGTYFNTTGQSTITVNAAPSAPGYTVDLSASPASVQAGGNVDVTLTVTGTESTFNAFYAQLSYDSNFTFVDESSYANNFAVAKTSGSNVLTITRTGESLTAIDTGTALTLHFTAEDVTAVTEVSAAFTLNVPKVDKAANADSQNAPEAAITGSPAAVTINPIATYTVTYNANGATGGAVPTDSNSYVANAEVTVLGNTGSLVKTGHTFNGWNTSADGEGTSYAAGDIFAITENTTLYAQWTVDTYTVTLYDNGADSCGTLTGYTYGVGATLPIPTRAGYTFDGWYEDASFSGDPVTVISATDTDEKVFYAKWTANTTVTVSAYCDGFTLIKVTGTLEAGKTFAYDSNAMYSDGNGNYYYVVAGTVGVDIAEDDAKAKVSRIAGSSAALTIDRDGDANQTGTVDINDAQFIYNLHSGYYKTSGTTVSVDKLLEADVNGDGKVDTWDIPVAVAAIE